MHQEISTNSDSLDILPPRVVEKLLGVDGVTIWRMRRRGEFPSPIQLSPGRIGYRRADIERWLEQRAAAATT
jgi:prophage regulatory protein